MKSVVGKDLQMGQDSQVRRVDLKRWIWKRPVVKRSFFTAFAFGTLK